MRVNALNIYAINKNIHPRNTDSFEFGWELAMTLISPHIKTTKNSAGLCRTTLTKMNLVLNVQDDPVLPVRASFSGNSENEVTAGCV